MFIIGNVDNDVSHIVVHLDGRDYTIENKGEFNLYAGSTAV